MERTYIDDNCEEWINKCLKCKHYYVKKNNIDEVFCSCKDGCNFEPLTGETE